MVTATVTNATSTSGQAQEDFTIFFERHHRELSRLAYLLTGDHLAADDLTADTFVATWRQWDQVRATDRPSAYVRRVLVNLAATRIRRLTRERRRLPLFHVSEVDTVTGPDGAAVLDIRAALQKLPTRRRACVVLRHALDLSEAEVARTLGISVGTVKSQTSKGLAQLRHHLGADVYGD